MKIIAKISGGKYIAEVAHMELEKFMGLYYGKMDKLKEGDEVDLGKGYNFHRDTCDAIKKTEDFIQSNREIMNAILNGFSVLANSAGKEVQP